jgi:hypothetical protein
LEIEYALKRGIPIIPVLINNTPMPKSEKLPSDIQGLAFRHALPLDSGLDFRQHAERLITGICDLGEFPEAPMKIVGVPKLSHLPSSDGARARNFLVGAIILLVAVVGGMAWVLTGKPRQQAKEEPTAAYSPPTVNSREQAKKEDMPITQIARPENMAQATPAGSITPIVIDRRPAAEAQPTVETSAVPTSTIAQTNQDRLETTRKSEAPPRRRDTDVFIGTWEGSYYLDVVGQEGQNGPFPIRLVVSAGHSVSKTISIPANTCDNYWSGNGPGVLACFGRDGFESFTVREDGLSATYFAQDLQNQTNINATLRKQ